jgi:hypothetical protein
MAELPVLSVLEIPETKTIDVIAVVGGAHGSVAALSDMTDEERS